MVLAIPLAAIIIVGALFYVTYSSQTQAAMHIHPRLVIQIIGANSNRSNFQSQFILAKDNIGAPGGIMYTTKYLGDGVNGFYPLHTQFPSCLNVTRVMMCTIHVESKVVRAYTLGDFFDVWGYPLGRENTLGYQANDTIYTVHPPQPYPFYWDMCVREPGVRTLPNDEWGAHVLKDGEVIFLVFSQIGCG